MKLQLRKIKLTYLQNKQTCIFDSSCQKNSTSQVGFEGNIMFEVFCSMILTDAWQPVISVFGGHGINADKFSPPSVTHTFLLASGKCMELSDNLISHKFRCSALLWNKSKKTGSTLSWLLEFHSCFFDQTIISTYWVLYNSLHQRNLASGKISRDTYCTVSSAVQH